MTAYTHKASKFLRNSLEVISNMTDDSFLNKLEGRLFTIGQFIQQRHGMESYRELLNAVYSDKE